jgi:hypothetical protein
MSLEVVAVEGSRQLSAFIDVPWHIPEAVRHPQWVPPLRMMVRDLLDTKTNPFYRTADRALFVARRHGKPVGRIAAIENRAHNVFHDDRVGFFGFFESIDDDGVVRALVGRAGEWLAARGLTSIRGPVNPSTNHDCGLLVEGFDVHPQFLTPWNPSYYERLLRGAGFSATKELLAYWLPYGDAGYELPEKFRALAERGALRNNLVFRDLDPSRYWDEVEICWGIYNSAWERNWGFVPMSRDEFYHLAKGLRAVLVPQFAFVAEINGAPAGFMLSTIDMNLLFKRVRSGRLFPSGLFRILAGKHRLRTGRVLALGIREEFRTRSILPLFMYEAARRAIAWGSPGAEASWILDENHAMRTPLESLGGRVYRRWRILDRQIGRAA